MKSLIRESMRDALSVARIYVHNKMNMSIEYTLSTLPYYAHSAGCYAWCTQFSFLILSYFRRFINKFIPIVIINPISFISNSNVIQSSRDNVFGSGCTEFHRQCHSIFESIQFGVLCVVLNKMPVAGSENFWFQARECHLWYNNEFGMFAHNNKRNKPKITNSEMQNFRF